ncbi:hypothetical protein ACLH1R_07135 [Klebsiella sp. 1SOBk13mer]|uniref:hypothetical protein n=1 Tax=Klebsiella TaxID=570 RepID=UPI0010F6AF14|nr:MULTISPECIES: hypothetical protein [Klebsiella]MBY7262064.1 hypothetical protein [Klebsiella variicola]MBZ6540380.1 hypothetical protein [Klebsiella variicola]MCE7484240.1 hypothetical protein [Klebsiella variicola]MDV0624090.1 hypothetical protein [Klebsiella variicola subsp. variicola]MEC5750302.1 hypothetical protein [Klebsiella variicola]
MIALYALAVFFFAATIKNAISNDTPNALATAWLTASLGYLGYNAGEYSTWSLTGMVVLSLVVSVAVAILFQRFSNPNG